MATRCSIIVEGVDLVKIYKHWDGYPSNMVAWLSEFNQDFSETLAGVYSQWIQIWEWNLSTPYILTEA